MMNRKGRGADSARASTRAEQLLADPPKRIQQILLAMFALCLIVLLGFQVRSDWIEPYAQTPAMRPWIEGFCKLAFCTPPARQSLDDLRLMEIKIAPHLQFSRAIRVDMRLVNDAPFAQPYPHLEAILSDQFGRVVGRRRYRPADYLPEPDTSGIESGQQVSLTLDLMQPDFDVFGLAFAPVAGDAP